MDLKNLFRKSRKYSGGTEIESTRHEIITIGGDGSFSFDGNIYENDIIRSIVHRKASIVSKAVANHIRYGKDGKVVNDEPYMRQVLRNPNQLMSMQQMLEKVMIHLELNNNAFIHIRRNEYGVVSSLVPIQYVGAVVAYQDANYEYYFQFQLELGEVVTYPLRDIIHLKQHYNTNLVFGDSNQMALAELMEIVNTVDRQTTKALSASNIIKWLLKGTGKLNKDDKKANAKEFSDAFLSDSSDTGGVAFVDDKVEAKEIQSKSMLPDSKQLDATVQRIYQYFGVNEKILQGNYNENEWTAFYESVIEPVIRQLSAEFTKKLFTPKERAHGNEIKFEASDFSYLSTATKITMFNLVDRGVISRNELREIFNYAPYEGGDDMVLRLDTTADNAKGRNEKGGGNE